MSAKKHIATYHRMRSQPLWRLLASAHGPVIIALLQTHLYEHERSLPASILFERLGQELEALRASGYDMPQTAQTYVAGWLKEGFLHRRFPPGASEEEYELTTATVEAIRFLTGLVKPHASATESRLSMVIQALNTLAEDTDADRQRRIDRLLAERERIDREIENIRQGKLRVLPAEAALERSREIIALADELSGDFHRVRDRFEALNRELRENIMDSEGNRGEVLDALFAGIDLISESEEGRSFTAFWRLLTDPEQSAILSDALDNIMARDFVDRLDMDERRFLLRMTRNLLAQGSSVHEVLQTFARSLKHFVQSREYQEQRRINRLLGEAQRAALAAKEHTRATGKLDYTLELTSSRLQSLSQWVLYDPSLEAAPETMAEGEAPGIALESISELVAQSEIDFRSLRQQVQRMLEDREQASIAEVLQQYPAEQGLGSIVGLVALASRHGIRSDNVETVSWTGEDKVERRARIPKIYFLRERIDELV